MIDPFTAMAAVSSAVGLIKKAMATVDDVRSLGPLLGKYFDAKQEAVKVVEEAKKEGGSNMGRAIEIELALKQQQDFERQLRDLFYYSGNADVWDAIEARVKQMDEDDALKARDLALEKRRIKDAEQKQKKKLAKLKETFLAIGVLVVGMIFCSYWLWKMIDYCDNSKNCGY